jgi:hypothetical protein
MDGLEAYRSWTLRREAPQGELGNGCTKVELRDASIINVSKAHGKVELLTSS